MTATTAKTVLVPGAWMGAWVWEPTVARLRDRGIDADAITLRGLQPGEPAAEVATIRLDDHVQQLVEHVERQDAGPVVLVSHSYSAMVTASAADRLGDRVLGLVHVGGFLPVTGRSLLDDWGSSDEARAQERADIEAAGHLWPAPTREDIAYEADLTPADLDHLSGKFTPHPGRTLTDHAKLSAPIANQPSTYVALTTSGGLDEAWREAPAVAVAATGWRRRHIVSGHWPMVSALDVTVDLLEAEIRHYDGKRG